MRFGFSYVGLIYLMMLTAPNLLWTRNRPKDYARYAARESRVLRVLERAGEAMVTCAALVFADFNLRPWTAWSWWLVASFALMLLYEVFWLRYFRSEKTMGDFCASLLGVPVAGATLPVAAFLLLAVYGRNCILGIGALILGVGHVGIHLAHKRECVNHEHNQNIYEQNS